MAFLTNLYGTRAYLKHIRGKFDEAEKWYEKAFSRSDRPTRAQDYAGYAGLLIRKEQYQKAYDVITEGISVCKLNPKQRMRILSLTSQYVIALWKLGRLDEAIAEEEQVHEKMPSTSTYGTLGYFYVLKAMQTGDYEKALSFNRDAVDYADDDPTILDNLAQALYRTGEYEEAKKYFELALEEKPTQVDSLLYLARTCEAMGDMQSALSYAKKAAAQKASKLSAVTDEMTSDYLKELESKIQKNF